MSSASFRVVYDGPALTDHAMDVRDLAPALLAIAETLEEANRIVNADRAHVRVQVHGSFKTGSFGIDFSVDQSFVAHALQFLSNDARIVGSLNLLALLGFVGGTGTGLVKLIKWLRGRKIRGVEIRNEDVTATVITDDDRIEVEAKTIELFRSYKIRQSVERALKAPLDREGIESVAFVYEEQVTEVIERRDRSYFTAPKEQAAEQISENEYTVPLQLVSVPMREGYLWRVDDGAGSFTATVLDGEYVQRIQLNEVEFFAGDILTVRLRRRQFMREGKLTSENEIFKIIHHASASRQIPLPIIRHGD